MATTYDFEEVADYNFKWKFSKSDNPLLVELGPEYIIGSKYGLDMFSWLIEHNVQITPYNYEKYSFELPNLDVKLEFILRWS